MRVASKKVFGCLLALSLMSCVNQPRFSALEPGRAYNSDKSDQLNPQVIKPRLDQPNPAFYLVRPGDTLYSIAFRFGLDYKKLAEANNVDSDFRIFVGQSLALKEVELGARNTSPAPIRNDNLSSETISSPVTKINSQNFDADNSTTQTPSIANNSWVWPHNGNIVRTFLDGVSTRKGIDIQGRIGDSVHAAATGTVVYAGNGLPGYGNLIILEHANALLSAYAFNESIMVKERDQVAAGDKIATMGKQGDQPGLHFEIRRDGKPVDPELYLPKR